MSRLPVDTLPTSVRELDLGTAKVYHLENWHQLSHPERLKIIRQIAEQRGRDPRIAKLAASIIKRARPREFDKQAALLLKWVQDNIYYMNEPGERLQDPIYTIEAKHADCDDMAILLCALFEAIRLSWLLCLSGKDSGGKKVRYIEGNVAPEGVNWGHIYCMVGVPPFEPKKWYFCEPTVRGVPLGWDVISGPKSYLPKYLPKYRGQTHVVQLAGAPLWKRRPAAPPPEHRSPAYEFAMGDALYGDSSGSRFVPSLGEDQALAQQEVADEAAQPTQSVDQVQAAAQAAQEAVDQAVRAGTQQANFLVRDINTRFAQEGGWDAFKRRVAFNVATGIPGAIIASLFVQYFLSSPRVMKVWRGE